MPSKFQFPCIISLLVLVIVGTKSSVNSIVYCPSRLRLPVQVLTKSCRILHKWFCINEGFEIGAISLLNSSNFHDYPVNSVHFEKLSRRDFTFYYIHFLVPLEKNFNLDIGMFFNGKSFMLNTWQTARRAAARLHSLENITNWPCTNAKTSLEGMRAKDTVYKKI